jgi:3-hydroxyacyl-[acyl-carrier-protein] dehydratase
MVWDQDKIRSILPHRAPFLFLDEVLEIEGTQKIVAVKHLKDSEDFLRGHFPGNPIMPGVLIVEAMAQTSVLLFSVDRPHIASMHPDYYLGKVKAEFFAPVRPGDSLIIEAQKVKFLDNAAITDTVARVRDQTVAKANLVFGIQKK